MIRQLILIALLSCACLSGISAIKTDSWLQGCYWAGSQLIPENNKQPQNLTLVSCAKHCRRAGWVSAAVRENTTCLCLNSTTSLKKIDDNNCDVRCTTVNTDLPCGGTAEDVVNVYTSSGPYLLDASTAATSQWVVTSIPQTLEARAYLAASHGNCSQVDGDDTVRDDGNVVERKEEAVWWRKLQFVWKVGDRIRREETVITACNPFHVAHTSFTFSRTGTFTIELTVSNAVSRVHTSHTVDVLKPSPRGLQLSPYNQTLLHMPSCLNHFSRSALSMPNGNGTTDRTCHGLGLGPPALPLQDRGRDAGKARKSGSQGSDGSGSSNGEVDSAAFVPTSRHATSELTAASDRRGWKGKRSSRSREATSTTTTSPTLQQPRPPRERVDYPPATAGKTWNGVLSPHSGGHAHEDWSGDTGWWWLEDGDADHEDDVAVVAAFAGERFELLAEVNTGLRPQFDVSRVVQCSEEGEVMVGDVVSRPAACLNEENCRSVVQELTFPDPGLHSVHVTASNQHGQDQRHLTMVIVDRKMGQVKLSVQEPVFPAYPTNHSITFHLTVDTADRYNSVLYVFFGDDRVGFAMLRETKSSVEIRQADPGMEMLELAALRNFHNENLGAEKERLLTQLTASYGEGCELKVEFAYKYRMEGVFNPHVKIVNIVTQETITETLSSPLTVVNSLVGPSRFAPSPVTVGTVSDLVLHLPVTSSKLTVRWLIHDKVGQVLVNATTRRTEISVVFNETGVYRVMAIAKNMLSQVKASAFVNVQRRIENLKLQCNPSPPRITVDEEVECHAEVEGVSHVTYAWNFGDSGGETDVDSANMSSRASHNYVKQGVYSITVQASNNVSSVTTVLSQQVFVDTVVRCLCMDSSPVAPGEEVIMEVTAQGGTRLKFEYDVGYGRWAQHRHIQPIPPNTKAVISHVFRSPGIHPVMLYAHNYVSSAELAVHVVVQPLMGQLVLETSATANSSAVLVVQQGGKPLERDDIIYHVHFSDGTRIISASPVVWKNFSFSGKHRVNFTAFNEVDSVSHVLDIEQGDLVKLRGKPRLHHDAIVRQNQEIVFTILECPESAEVIEVHHSDGTVKVFAAKTNRWSHIFSSPGVHSVEVTIFGGRTGRIGKDRPSLHSVLLVQQPISGLRLTGPTLVGINCYNAWRAEVSEGSHKVCQWSFGGEREDRYTTVLQYGRSFREEGLYTLGIHCHNDISFATASINVTVHYPVTDLHLTVPVTAHTHFTVITATVHSGRQFTIRFDFGDGTIEDYESSILNLVRVSARFSKWQEQSPVYNVSIKHLYADIGAYNVSVTVSNEISSLTQRKQAFVEEAIGDIKIYTDVPDLINLDEKFEWTFRAVVGSGKNLKFAWVFDDRYSQDPAISDGNTSVATHEFDKVGEYEVKVEVRNHLQQEPVIARLPYLVRVQEPLTEVTIMQVQPRGNALFQTFGAYFSAKDNCSELVTFEARTAESPVAFLFDFGDGNVQEVEGTDQIYLFYAARANHRYTAEGVYTISVTASNALNNVTAMLSHPVYIQVPVTGPLLRPGTDICTRFGENTVLSAGQVQGSNVSFSWKLDDQTELVNANSTVRHKYRKTGVETVEVIASNQVSNITAYVDISVMEQIQSVELMTVTGEPLRGLVVEAGKPVTFKAQVSPPSPDVAQYFVWDTSQKVNYQSWDPTATFTFRYSRWTTVTVTAHNCHSKATSSPGTLVVMSKIKGLKISTEGDNLVYKLIKFTAHLYEGEFLNFIWDFGDGTPEVKTNNLTTWHSYNSSGEYMISLFAANALSNASIKHRLFILNRVCKPPTIKVVGLLLPSSIVQMWKWQSMRLESQVTVNCSVSDLTYRWYVHRLEGDQDWTAHRIPVGLDSELLRHPDLLLPPDTLEWGRYIVTVQVEMSGTEIPVYQELDVKVEVVRAPVTSTIRGGVLRQVSRDSAFTLVGGSSLDPDSNTHLKYAWRCRPLHKISGSCFNESRVNETSLKLDGPLLEVDASWFRFDESFLFNLTISADGFEPAHSTQVIQVKSDRQVIPLSLECKQCQDDWVNANEKITIVAHCHEDCSHAKLRYKWKLFIVEGDDPQEESDPNTVASTGGCGQPMKTMFRWSSVRKSNASVSAVTTTGKPSTTTTRAAKRPSSSVSEYDDIDTSTDSEEPMKGFPLPPWQAMKEYPGPRSRTDGYRRGESSRSTGTRGQMGLKAKEAVGNKHDSLGPAIPVDISEGDAPGRGSVKYPGSGMGGRPIPPYGDKCHGVVDCKELDTVQPLPIHISMRKNSELDLKPDFIASDPDGPSLVLKPGALVQGLTYLVEVTASDPDNPDAGGMAKIAFTVNKSPWAGGCSVRPSSGVEMDTVFVSYCREWKDEHLPLWYEVGYSLEDGESATPSPSSSSLSSFSAGVDHHVIYQGLSGKVNFRLPAGLPQNGGKVFVELRILDNRGAATGRCNFPITVTPRAHLDASDTVKDYANYNTTSLRNDVKSLQRIVETSVYRGDRGYVQDLHEIFAILATRLNRMATAVALDRRSTINDTLLFASIRLQLMKTLTRMPRRDQVEVGKTLRSLLHATSPVSQIDGQTFSLGVQLLEKISKTSRPGRGWRGAVSQNILALTLQTISNLIQAATQSNLMLLVKNMDQKRLAWTQRSMNVIHDVLTLALRDHVLGEAPIHHQTKFISMIASHYPSFSPSSVNIGQATFHLPHDMVPILNKTVDVMVDEGDSYCFQARAISFQQNPFIYRKETPPKNIEVQSEVVSLDVFSCDGEKLSVQGLDTDNNVEIIIPLTSSVESDWKYQLSREHMNIHRFNISESQEELYLTLLVNLAPVPTTTRPFPITAVISQNWPPDPKNNLYRRDFPRDSQQLHIFLSPNETKGSLDGAGTFYFGLVETSLNSGRRPRMEVMSRNYTLSSWFGSCLYWNSTTTLWSDSGCRVMPKTTTTAAHCQCNHLTVFGSHFELVPNDLSFTDIETFFGLHENPVVVILVSTVMLIYIVLLVIVCRADCHDLRKGGLVCLSDNNISDSQIYEIVLDTGLQQSAPTTAKISIILHGELGMSETRELISEDDRPMFERSSRDRFLLTLPDSLGRIFKVQLWHNNAGDSPRWFLTQVLVRDLNTGKVQFFLCEKWFAVDEGDGRVERELVALDNSVSFMQIFMIKWKQYMADFHTWGSIFTRPAHSNFTRAQRLTCCLTLLLSYMALNAMWYCKQPKQRRGEFGLLDISWRSLAVGAICCTVVFPMHLFLAFLFRRSRISHATCQHKIETSNRTTIAATTTPVNTPTYSVTTPTTANTNINSGSVSHYGETPDTVASTQTMTTYSLLDQSILNWQSIQDWAQRQWVKRQQSTRSSAVSVKTNAQPSTQPCPTQPVQHTLLAGDDTDQASSGFEDAVSQATAERHRIKPASESSSEGRRSQLGEEENGGPHICLPAWCRYVAWSLCAVICTFSATVTILYGFRFGPTKSIFWLQSLYFSFMVCIFFAQPFWIIITVVCLALKNRNNPAVFDHCCERSEVQEGISTWHSLQKQLIETSDENTELERGVRARQRSRYLRFSRPPQDKVLQESRKKLMKEKNAASFLREVVVFVFMFTLVCVIAYGKDLSSHFMLKQSLDTILLRGDVQSFHTIQNIPDWHHWAQTTFLDAVYGSGTSPGLLLKDGQGQGNNVLIGHPFLQQLRVHQQPCPEFPYLPHTAQYCRYGYSSSNRDVGRINDTGTQGGSAVWGEMAMYNGIGFGLSLNQSSKEEALMQLEALEMNGWIDRRSRAVIVEMTILNVPMNLFSSLVLLLELPPSGGALPSPRISSTALFRYVTTWDNCVLACELLFMLLALVRIQNELAAMVENGRHYFVWPWNYTQMLLCMTALGYTVCYIYRFVLVSEIVEFLRSTYYEQFISLAFLTAWDELLKSLTGILVFLVVVTQGLCLVRYCPHLAKFAAVYRRARREVMLLGLLFFVISGAFTTCGSLLFGSLSRSMRTTWSTSLSVVALMTGIYSPPDLEMEGSPWFSIFSIFSFTLGCGLLTAYMVAILTHRLRVSKNGDLLVMGKCELLDYCIQQALLFIGIRKHTPVHEPEVHLPPECTLAEFEYQVEELLFRMNALAGTTNLPEKPTGYLTDSDQSQAIGDDGISSGGSEPAVDRSGGNMAGGEEGRLEQRVQKIEDKLCANEPYLAQLLKLDSIGADILSQEKEKQLRSHLELEIFRQLQMRRQETGEMPVATATTSVAVPPSDIKGQQCANKAADNLLSLDLHGGVGHGSYSDEKRLPLDVDTTTAQMTSSDDSPGSERALLRISGSEPEPFQSKGKPGRSGYLNRNRRSGGRQLFRTSTAPDDSLLTSDLDSLALRRPAADLEFSESLYAAKKPDVLPSSAGKAEGMQSFSGHKHSLSDATPMDRSDSMRGSRRKGYPDFAFAGMERADSLKVPSKKHFPDLSCMERSDSLRVGSRRHPSADMAVVPMERSDSLRSAGKKPELPPKPTFAVVPVIDSRRSPKPPPLKIHSERVLHRADAGQANSAQAGGSGSLWRGEVGGSGHLGESSSGSEQDGLFNAGGMTGGASRRPQGQGRRNLRKTKSRGKGKGSGTLTPTLLLDELSFTVHEPPRDLEDIGDVAENYLYD